MALALKIDSNITGLRIAEEESTGVLPATPVWEPLEPNTYSNFGGEIKTVARNPISSDRQRKKGVTTDLDAQGGFNMDITQTNVQKLMQGAMFADLRRKPEVLSSEASVKSVVDSTPDYFLLNNLEASGTPVVAAGGTGYAVDDVLTVSGGTSVTPTTLRVVTVSTGVITEVEIVEPGLYSVAPTNDVSVTGGGGTGAEFTMTYTNLVTFLANHLILASGFGTEADNGLKTVTAFSTSGTHVEVSETLVADASAAAEADIVAVGYQFASATLDVDATPGSYPRLVRASGAFDFTTLGLIPGESIFIGGDSASLRFSTSANNGFARVRVVAAAYIELDKTADVMVDETGTGKTIQIFIPRLLKNETGTLVKTRTYQLERTLGAPDEAEPTEIQSEYLTKSILNEAVIKIPTADKATIDFTFIAGDSETRTGVQGVKSGTRPDIEESDAFNTSSDVARIKMAQVVAGDSCPDPLFSYLKEINITLNNNVTPNKAVGVLGAFSVSVGTFAVSGTMTGYFADVAAVAAVRNNVDITLDLQLVKANAGISLDLPLISLGDGKPNVAQDAAIEIPLNMDAANGAKVDASLNHTVSLAFFDYLPDLAEV